MTRLTLLLLCAVAPALAQDKPEIRYDATTMILPAGAHAIRDVVDATAKFLQRNILTDPQELAAAPAPVELQNAMQLDRKGCEEAVSELLFSRGFVLVPRDESKGLYEVVFMNGPRGRDLGASAPHRTPEQIRARPGLQQPVTTLVTLQNVNATVAANSLRPFFAGRKGGPSLTLGSTGDNRSLLLSGIQSEVASALEILRQTDGPPPGEGKGPPPPDLQRKVAELEQTVATLLQRIAELEKRLGGDGK
jgi:hypothetical protein